MYYFCGILPLRLGRFFFEDSSNLGAREYLPCASEIFGFFRDGVKAFLDKFGFDTTNPKLEARSTWCGAYGEVDAVVIYFGALGITPVLLTPRS